MDYEMINAFAEELAKIDPENPRLKQYLSMDNFEGSELRKHLKTFPWSDKIPELHGKRVKTIVLQEVLVGHFLL